MVVPLPWHLIRVQVQKCYFNYKKKNFNCTLWHVIPHSYLNLPACNKDTGPLHYRKCWETNSVQVVKEHHGDHWHLLKEICECLLPVTSDQTPARCKLGLVTTNASFQISYVLLWWVMLYLGDGTFYPQSTLFYFTYKSVAEHEAETHSKRMQLLSGLQWDAEKILFWQDSHLLPHEGWDLMVCYLEAKL